jgi:outer membrane protein OmpA-like peptidoglycan-associated protein
MITGARRVISAVALASALVMSAAASAQTPSGAPATPLPVAPPPASAAPPPAATAPAPARAPSANAQQLPRFLVYFNEFSAYLSPRSKEIIANAAKEAKTAGATSITVQARASATGTVQTNKYLAMTRSSIVADELEADGIDAATIQQEPIGQTGSKDPSVFNRRVDIILHR